MENYLRWPRILEYRMLYIRIYNRILQKYKDSNWDIEVFKSVYFKANLGTTISVSCSYFECQSFMVARGTQTNKVVRYSESRTKCSFEIKKDSQVNAKHSFCLYNWNKCNDYLTFFTKSPRFLVNRLPVCFFSMLWRLT